MSQNYTQICCENPLKIMNASKCRKFRTASVKNVVQHALTIEWHKY